MFRLKFAFLLALTALAPAANAQSFSAAGIPDGAAQKLTELANAGQTPKSIAFTDDGGWAILYGNSGFAAEGTPDGFAEKLSELANAGNRLDTIAFTRDPGGVGWLILHGGGYWYAGLPDGAVGKLGEALGAGLKSIAFTPDGGWAMLYGSRGFASGGIPASAAQKLSELANAGESFKSIAFTPGGGWAILHGSNGFAWDNIPAAAARQLSDSANAGRSFKSIAFSPGGGWAILLDSAGGNTGGGNTGGGNTATGPSAQELKALEDQVFALVNQERQKAGLAPYTRSAQLDTAARRHSLDMATKENFSHKGTDGTEFWDRTAQAGYAGAAAGENIAGGSSTADGVMSSWMNSTGHRANILSASANEIGISVVHQPGSTWKYYWTQVMGTR